MLELFHIHDTQALYFQPAHSSLRKPISTLMENVQVSTPKPVATAAERTLFLAARKYRIIIADDHTIMREGLRALLESDGRFEVVDTVENGREAVRAVMAHEPDVVLMDLAMPQMDGLTAIHQLKRLI